jgi:hypothetical protein
MKWIPCFLILLSVMAACSKTKTIEFCEGVSPDGKGVNCGSKFEDGELTAVVNSEEPFGVKTITVQVFEVKKNKTEKMETLSLDVKPDKDMAMVNLSFYSGGRYMVTALKNNMRIGSGEVEIVER